MIYQKPKNSNWEWQTCHEKTRNAFTNKLGFDNTEVKRWHQTSCLIIILFNNFINLKSWISKIKKKSFRKTVKYIRNDIYEDLIELKQPSLEKDKRNLQAKYVSKILKQKQSSYSQSYIQITLKTLSKD